MEDADPPNASGRRLTFSTENFDDYLVALMADLRNDAVCDRVLSGELRHPLIEFQRQNIVALQQLNVPWVSPAALLANPVSPYVDWLRVLTANILAAPAPVPAVAGLQQLQQDQNVYRNAERLIYARIVKTLRVGRSMHYARQCAFGAGQLLLQTIVNDNRQVTTRSLMALFSTLFSLILKDDESFEQFERRIGLLIQRLRSWRPPVVLPEQLLLFCALRALPELPYGPVRHIILASPNISYLAGMSMLKDVANTGGQLIASTLGSSSAAAKKHCLCALCT